MEEVLRLLDGGHDPNIGSSPRTQQIVPVNRFLGADDLPGDELGETPLFEAASAGSVDVVAALLVKRADPDKILSIQLGRINFSTHLAKTGLVVLRHATKEVTLRWNSC